MLLCCMGEKLELSPWESQRGTDHEVEVEEFEEMCGWA